jgi:hypothetical protein
VRPPACLPPGVQVVVKLDSSGVCAHIDTMLGYAASIVEFGRRPDLGFYNAPYVQLPIIEANRSERIQDTPAVLKALHADWDVSTVRGMTEIARVT